MTSFLHIGHNAGSSSPGWDAGELGGELRVERGESSASKSIDSGSLNDELARVEMGLELTGTVRGILDPGDDSDILGHELWISCVTTKSLSGCELDVDFLSSFLTRALGVRDFIRGELASGVAGD